MPKSKKLRVLIAEAIAVILVMVLGGLDWLPIKDNPETLDVNEAHAFLITLIAAIIGGGGLYQLSQGISDGGSKGATSSVKIDRFAGSLLIVCLGLSLGAMGCAAPAGVLKAADHMDQAVGSMANQYATMVTLTAMMPAEKAEAMAIFNVDWEDYQTYREHFRDYLKAGLSEMEATEYIRIGKQIHGAVASAGKGGGG